MKCRGEGSLKCGASTGPLTSPIPVTPLLQSHSLLPPGLPSSPALPPQESPLHLPRPRRKGWGWGGGGESEGGKVVIHCHPPLLEEKGQGCLVDDKCDGEGEMVSAGSRWLISWTRYKPQSPGPRAVGRELGWRGQVI